MSWISYAQNFEDVTLMRALRQVPQGFYIDVGAHDPTADSVTRAFYERGWCGINIEPIPAAFERFERDRPRDINLPVAAGSMAGGVTLYEVEGTGLSTADAAQARVYEAEGLTVRPLSVPRRSLNEICTEWAPARAIHFLKIDVEGAEREVLQGLDLSRHRPWVILVEATRPRSAQSTHEGWESLLLQGGYRFVWFDGLNRFYVADERADLSVLLAQPPSVQDDFMRYTERFLRDDVADYAKLLEIERARVAMLEGLLTQGPLSTASTAASPPASLAPLRPLVGPAEPDGVALTPPRRPRLALFTPWPPDASGIADSAAVLLPHLQRHFEVDVIAASAHAPLSVDGFRAHARHFDHICFHLGNSLFHEPVLDLLPEYGGTVVVHDFLISDCLWYLQRTARRPHAWVRALYRGHGWNALAHIRDAGIEAAVRRWPASLDLLRHADGLIFTSEFSHRWWLREITAGESSTPAVVVPLPHPIESLPGSGGVSATPRRQARLRLGVSPDAFVVASFGAVDRSKAHDHLARIWPQLESIWQGQGFSPRLVCVGAKADPSLADQLTAAGVLCTGHAPPEVYDDWLNAADVAVQLRRDSRGESSGALLQCMGAGLACIVSRHGPMADLPPRSVWHLDPEADLDTALIQALQALQANPTRRAELGQAAREHVRAAHDAQAVASAHAHAIAAFSRKPRNTPRPPATLWVEVTAICVHDLGTGVQRVTRNIVRHLLERGVTGWRVEPVVLNQGRYWTCRNFIAQFLGLPPEIAEGLPTEEPADVAPGDTWFGLDLVTDGVHQHESTFSQWRGQGVRLAFMVHDLLPLTNPEYFPPEAVRHFQGWWQTVTRVADVLACNSQATADSVRRWWQEHGAAVPRVRAPLVQAFGLGCDLDRRNPEHQPDGQPGGQLGGQPGGQPVGQPSGQPGGPPRVPPPALPSASSAALSRIEGAVLMVGTVEPRKGIDDALDVLETRWRRGDETPLVIVGRRGWHVQALVDRLTHHPERGRRLHWLEAVDDAQLEQLYRSSRLLLAASRAEGYGLPLVEALHHGLPVLARDIPVFREIAGESARYWRDPADLLQILSLALIEDRTHAPGPPAPLTWLASVQALLPLILGPGASLRV